MKLIPTSIQPVTITLYQGVPFDNNYEEHSLFSNKFTFKAYQNSVEVPVGRNKDAFLDINDGAYYFPRTTKTGTFNFAFGNGIVTSVIMELTGNEINSNYMKVVSGTDSYYYFITGIVQKNETTYLLNLELDVVMTYTDEFLDAIEDKPVMVERKHCRRIQRTKFRPTSPITTKINPVCFNQESTFNKMKPNIVKTFTPLQFKDFVNGSYDFNDIMSEIMWFYVIVGKGAGINDFKYSENGITYPYYVICVPNKNMYLDIIDGETINRTLLNPNEILDKLIGNQVVQKIILSPFPPFKICDNMRMERVVGEDRIVWTVNGSYSLTEWSFYTGINQTGTFFHYKTTEQLPYSNTLYIQNAYGGKFEYETQEEYFNNDIPTTNDTRDAGEYKLQIAPFKDLRMSSYYGGENHISTQYLFLKEYSGGAYDIKPYTIASSNAEVNSYFDYVDLENYDVDAKRGLSSSVAYNFPTGSDAELLYNQTAKNQYENSKMINALTNGLKIIGGALGVVFGGVMAKTGGALSIASGVEGEIQTIADYNAKMEDLKNTPNSYNFSGSSFPYDFAIAQSGNKTDKNLLPYLLTYGVTDLEFDMAGEFMYNYGYEYNAESYFNQLISNGNDTIFNRKLFNYVKIREDITSKLVSQDLPINVAKKFNEILNAGIKFWTFFGEFSSMGVDYDKYFQKTQYCNAELCNETMPQ